MNLLSKPSERGPPEGLAAVQVAVHQARTRYHQGDAAVQGCGWPRESCFCRRSRRSRR